MGCGGGCGCAPCGGVSALELAADPAKRKLVGQTIGGFPHFVFGSDVDALKRSIHPSMLATNLAVRDCAGLTPSETEAWGQFFAAWTAFHDEETPTIIGSGRRYDEAIAYREQLGAWQEQLRAKCKIPGSIVKPSDESDASNISSAVRWGAVAVIAVAVVYGVRTVLPR